MCKVSAKINCDSEAESVALAREMFLKEDWKHGSERPHLRDRACVQVRACLEG